MWLFLVANWKSVLAAVLAAGLTWYIADARKDYAVAAAIAEEKKACENNVKITEGVSHALQEKLSKLDTDYAALSKRVRGTCVPFTSNTAGHGDAPGGNGFPRARGVDAGDLVDLARIAQKQTEQLISCQALVQKVWEANR